MGGLVKGTAGFGDAIVSTAVLATLFSPTVAAVPGLVGGAVGHRLRRRLSEGVVTAGAVLLLAISGVKPFTDGLAGL